MQRLAASATMLLMHDDTPTHRPRRLGDVLIIVGAVIAGLALILAAVLWFWAVEFS